MAFTVCAGLVGRNLSIPISHKATLTSRSFCMLHLYQIASIHVANLQVLRRLCEGCCSHRWPQHARLKIEKNYVRLEFWCECTESVSMHRSDPSVTSSHHRLKVGRGSFVPKIWPRLHSHGLPSECFKLVRFFCQSTIGQIIGRVFLVSNVIKDGRKAESLWHLNILRENSEI